MDTKNRIANIIINIFEETEIVDDLFLINLVEDLGMDSLTYIELIVSLEDEFNIEFSMDELDIEKLKTIDSIAKIVEELLKKDNKVIVDE